MASGKSCPKLDLSKTGVNIFNMVAQSSGDTFGRLGGERIASQYVYTTLYHLSFVASKPARLDLDARSSSPYPGSHKMEGCVERFGQGTDRAGDESSLSLGNSVEQL